VITSISRFFQLLVIIALILTSAVAVSAADKKSYKRTIEKYSLPDVTLINQDGKRVRLKSLLESDKPVIVYFIFGTCTTICPVLSAGYVNLQNKLGADAQKVHLVSISIDPENDTPKVLKEYLKRYRAKPGWDFFTGSRKDIDAVMRGFDAYIPNKMSHYALTLIHMPKEESWVRIFGILSSSEFLAETRNSGIK
jgi:protein SCO1/2